MGYNPEMNIKGTPMHSWTGGTKSNFKGEGSSKNIDLFLF